MHNRDILFRLLECSIEQIGLFRTYQLLTDTEINNHTLARRFELHPRFVADLRNCSHESKLVVKQIALDYLSNKNQLQLKLTA
jgi:hypothetical protein